MAPCRYPRTGGTLPDHGELWSSAWDTAVEGDGGSTTTVTARTRGVVLPYRFTRVLRLEQGTGRLELDYLVDEVGEDLDVIWSAHPLLTVERGMSVHLPDSTVLHVYSSPAGTLPEPPLPWPFVAQGHDGPVDLSTLPGPEAGLAFKLWSEPLVEGWAELRASDGTLRMTFDVDQVPQVGLWLNAGGWSGAGSTPYWNLAIEPCIGAQDSLEEAVEVHDQFLRIAAGSSATWSLSVELLAG